MGCARYANGQLLDEAEKAGFEALITGDRSLPYQQNLTGPNIAVIIFSTNAWPIICTQPQTVQRAVANASPALSPLPPFAIRDDPGTRPPPPGSGANHTLLDHLRPKVEPILLHALRPVAKQIAAALSARHGLHTVHIVAHGAPGRVGIAAGHLDVGVLARLLAHAASAWRND
jgi:Domain of unknown function (DUF4347)